MIGDEARTNRMARLIALVRVLVSVPSERREALDAEIAELLAPLSEEEQKRAVDIAIREVFGSYRGTQPRRRLH